MSLNLGNSRDWHDKCFIWDKKQIHYITEGKLVAQS